MIGLCHDFNGCRGRCCQKWYGKTSSIPLSWTRTAGRQIRSYLNGVLHHVRRHVQSFYMRLILTVPKGYPGPVTESLPLLRRSHSVDCKCYRCDNVVHPMPALKQRMESRYRRQLLESQYHSRPTILPRRSVDALKLRRGLTNIESSRRWLQRLPFICFPNIYFQEPENRKT